MAATYPGVRNPCWRHGDAVHLPHPYEYNLWLRIKQRCFNVAHHDYIRYGGRGITMYVPWRYDYALFLSYVGRSPSKLHSLDRWPNNNGNYEPGNLRWATPSEQARNRRNNHVLTIDGAVRTLAEWSGLSGVGASTIRFRLRGGMDAKSAVFSKPWQRSSSDEGCY